MGKGIVDKLKRKYNIVDEWIGLEIHPETPKKGVILEERFGRENLKRMLDNLNDSGKEYNIKFNNLIKMPNSHLALEASEYAKTKGKFNEFHEKLFYSYFTEGRDIGHMDVLVSIAKEVGLDGDDIKSALENNHYSEDLNNYTKQAHDMRINSTPTFIINDKYIITGAQPIDVFRKTLDKIIEENK